MSETGVSTAGPRIHALDALRGFALCGILIINIYQQVVFRGEGAAAADGMPEAVRLLFYERFYPIFSLLFGVGFGIFLQRASLRTGHPRGILARRLLVLLLIGAVHYVFHPGEALTAYAVAGLVVLLPLSYAPPRVALAVAVLLIVVGAQIVVGYGPIPGLLALGYALAAMGAPQGLERHPGRIAAAFAVFAVIGVAYTACVLAGVDLPRVNVVGGFGGGLSAVGPLGGLAVALAYSAGFLLLLRTPAGPGLSAVLAPMGRMALTNYLAATALFLLLGPVLGIDEPDDLPQVLGLTAGILVAQALWSRWWLGRFAYGPAEWLWRCATWWRRAPIRRTDGRSAGAAAEAK